GTGGVARKTAQLHLNVILCRPGVDLFVLERIGLGGEGLACPNGQGNWRSGGGSLTCIASGGGDRRTCGEKEHARRNGAATQELAARELPLLTCGKRSRCRD